MRHFLYGSCLLASALTAAAVNAAPPPLQTQADPFVFDNPSGDVAALFERLKALPPLPVVPQKPAEPTPERAALSDDMADILDQLPPPPDKAETTDIPAAADGQTVLHGAAESPAPTVVFENDKILPISDETDIPDQIPATDEVPEPDAADVIPTPTAADETPAITADTPAADEEPVSPMAAESDDETPTDDTSDTSEKDATDDTPKETALPATNDTPAAGMFQNTLFNGIQFPLLMPENTDATVSFPLLPRNMICSVTQNTAAAAAFECAHDTLGFRVAEKQGGGLELTPELPNLKPQDHLLRYQVTALGENPDRTGYCLIHRVITGAGGIVGIDLIQTPAPRCGGVGVKPDAQPVFITPRVAQTAFKDNRFYGDIVINGETWRLHPNYITHLTETGGEIEQCALIQDEESRVTFECIQTNAAGTLPPKRIFRAFRINSGTPPQVRLTVGETNALTGAETIGAFEGDTTRLVLNAFAEKATEKAKTAETDTDRPAALFQNPLFSQPLRRADDAPDQPGGLFGLTPGQKLPPLVLKDATGNAALYDRYCTLVRDEFNALVFDCALNAQPGTATAVSLPKKAFVTLAVRDCDDKTCHIVQALDTDTSDNDEGNRVPTAYTATDIDRLAQNTERFQILNVDVAAVIQEHLNARATALQPLDKIK